MAQIPVGTGLKRVQLQDTKGSLRKVSGRGSGRQRTGVHREEASTRRSRIVSSSLANGIPVAVLIVWWIASGSAQSYVLPDPIAVGKETVSLLVGADASDTWISMARIVVSLIAAMVLGAAFVFLAVLAPVTEKLVGNRIIPFLNSVSALGWAILGVIWFGIGSFAVIFVITAIIIPFCMVNLWEGMRNIDPELREMGNSFTRSRLRVLVLVEFPLVLPYVLAAARLGFSVAWKVALIAEFFGATSGLGLVMNRARQNFDAATVLATIVVVVIIVVIVERFIFDPLAKSFSRRMGTAGVTG